MSATTQTKPGSVLRFRKTKQGQWVAFGGVDYLEAGCVHTVFKADGTGKDFYVARVGKPFMVDGVRMAYGYPSDDIPTSTTRGGFTPSRRSCYLCGGDYCQGDCGGN
jgi:hypothetical protein